MLNVTEWGDPTTWYDVVSNIREECDLVRLHQLPVDGHDHAGNPSRIFHRATYLVARITKSGNLMEVARFNILADAKEYTRLTFPQTYVFHMAHPGIMAPFAMNVNYPFHSAN